MRHLLFPNFRASALNNAREVFLRLLLLCITVLCLPTEMRADETLVNVKEPVVHVDGNDYDVTVEFDIFRLRQPTETLYFDIGLEEDDTPGIDDIVAHHYECIAPNQWTEHVAAGFKAHINHLFDNVSQRWGDDYQKQEGEDVDEIPCPAATANVNGNTLPLAGGGWRYDFTVSNDPGLIAMNTNVSVVGLSVGDLRFQINPPLPHGQTTTVIRDDPRPPPLDEDGGGTELTTVPFTLLFSNGQTLQGATLGPMVTGPRLSLERSGDQVVISWKDPRFGLQTTQQLSSETFWFDFPEQSPVALPINFSQFVRLIYR